MKFVIDINGQRNNVDASVPGQLAINGQVLRVGVEKTGSIPLAAPSVPAVTGKLQGAEGVSLEGPWQKLRRDRAKFLLDEGSFRELAGPWGRGELGAKRGGRVMRKQIIDLMEKEFAQIANNYL